MGDQMEYEKERNEGIACNQRDCYYFDDTFDQFCAAEKSNGDPGPSYCKAYKPISKNYFQDTKEVKKCQGGTMNGNEAMAHRRLNETEDENSIMADVYYRCEKCVYRVEMPHDGGWCYMFKKLQVVCMKFRGEAP